MPFDLSMGEILVLLIVAVCVFGGRLPDAARKLGSAMSEFKRGMRDEMRRVEIATREDAAPQEWRRPGSDVPPPKDAAAEPTPRDP